jgi:hypothetical protein
MELSTHVAPQKIPWKKGKPLGLHLGRKFALFATSCRREIAGTQPTRMADNCTNLLTRRGWWLPAIRRE